MAFNRANGPAYTSPASSGLSARGGLGYGERKKKRAESPAYNFRRSNSKHLIMNPSHWSRPNHKHPHRKVGYPPGRKLLRLIPIVLLHRFQRNPLISHGAVSPQQHSTNRPEVLDHIQTIEADHVARDSEDDSIHLNDA